MDLVQVQADVADEIHQHQVGTSPSDLHPEGEYRIRVEPHRRRRLTDAAANRRAAHEQAVAFECAHDDGNGLCRKAGAPSDVRLRELSVTAHQRHHQPLVIGAHTGLVRPAARVDDFRLYRSPVGAVCQ
ncbi:hypothetical protein D3C86_1825320 [compost metagenome]